jgi:ATP-binding cassette, subfamily B, bacterial MsbA
MSVFWRILTYARPLRTYLPLYVIFTVISVVFGAINLVFLIPLLNIMFNEVTPEFIAEYSTRPEFSLVNFIDYFKHLFNYHFIQILERSTVLHVLYFVCIIIIFSFFIHSFFGYLSGIVMAKVRAKVIQKIRISIFEKITRLDISFFSNERKGDIMSRITNDVQEIELSVVYSLRVLFREPLMIIGYLVVMMFISAHLTIFALAYMLIAGAIISEIVKRLKKKATESQESLGRILSILDESLTGIRIIKAFNALKQVHDKFRNEVARYARINISMAFKNELATPLSQFLGVTVVAGLVIYGGGKVLGGTLNGSEFITFIAIFSQVLNPAKAISKEVSSIQRGLASGERIFKMIDLEPKIKEKENAVPLEEFKESIEYKNVHFAYGSEPVLKNINLKIKKGTTVALVGMSGGGKSTLADLVPRFYDPMEGEVLIDGVSLKDFQIESLRKHMGVVAQESILFNDTIFNNIAFGKPKASIEEVMNAARIANAHDFIIHMEDGYQTNIGERGTKLSGGQRQRISIARAVLKNPPILILDEATSSLDSESEKAVQDALTNLMKNRTSIIIAHRLSTIQKADAIYVIQEGEVVESGTHDELIENNKIYSKLSQMQSVS